MRDKETEVLLIAIEIEVYLDAHPNAADTLGGICKWWLNRMDIEQVAYTVELALKDLEKKNVVIKIISVDGKEIYRLAKDLDPESNSN